MIPKVILVLNLDMLIYKDFSSSTIYDQLEIDDY